MVDEQTSSQDLEALKGLANQKPLLHLAGLPSIAPGSRHLPVSHFSIVAFDHMNLHTHPRIIDFVFIYTTADSPHL